MIVVITVKVGVHQAAECWSFWDATRPTDPLSLSGDSSFHAPTNCKGRAYFGACKQSDVVALFDLSQILEEGQGNYLAMLEGNCFKY